MNEQHLSLFAAQVGFYFLKVNMYRATRFWFFLFFWSFMLLRLVAAWILLILKCIRMMEFCVKLQLSIVVKIFFGLLQNDKLLPDALR